MKQDGKENISAEQSSPGEKTRIPLADVNEERTSRVSASPRERSQTLNAASLLKTDFRLPKDFRLRKPGEFRHVYNNGKRYDGRFISAFILPNELSFHRIGITASRKGVGNAVQRNRAKRLLREAFRLSKIELNGLTGRYDFVLNARRSLLKIKMQDALADFQQTIKRIERHENRDENRDENGKQKVAESNPTAE